MQEKLRKCILTIFSTLLFNLLSANCKKMLDSGKITEHDGEMFCGSCYGKFFGPKGYGFGGGAGTLSMDDGRGYKVIFCIISNKIIN